MAKRIVVDFDALSYQCPYFRSETPDGCGYGCAHPDNDELEEMPATGELIGRCWNPGCPVCCGLDEEDLNDPDLDWDGYDRDSFSDLDGKFVGDEHATICCDKDATEDEKKLLYAYQRYMHRYNKEWLESHQEEPA